MAEITPPTEDFTNVKEKVSSITDKLLKQVSFDLAPVDEKGIDQVIQSFLEENIDYDREEEEKEWTEEWDSR